jgi:hypothetical protein
MSAHHTKRAAVGFTVKSGWASAVLVAGSAAAPVIVKSGRVELSDPDLPESRQPYHAGFGTARAPGRDLRRLVASVERFGRRSVDRWLAACRTDGFEVRGAGLVVGSLIDPATIGNDHIRIHALEGQLFRRVVAAAADESGVACSIWRERDLPRIAAAAFGRSDQELRRALTALGREIDGSWRTEQKLATLAGWLILAGKRGAPPDFSY